jgi:hypothetical protein
MDTEDTVLVIGGVNGIIDGLKTYPKYDIFIPMLESIRDDVDNGKNLCYCKRKLTIRVCNIWIDKFFKESALCNDPITMIVYKDKIIRLRAITEHLFL